jgi:hypothetical protein
MSATELLKILAQYTDLSPTLCSEVLNSSADDALAWYPSSGKDYHDVLELGFASRRQLHGLTVRPALFVHTDASVRLSGEFADDRTSVRRLSEVRFRIPDEVRHLDTLRDQRFDERLSEARLIKVEAVSTALGTVQAYVLHLPMSNYTFFARWVVGMGVNIHTVVQVRQGLGLGGCLLGLFYLYPWFADHGIRELLTDGEVHNVLPKVAGQVLEILVSSGANEHPEGFNVEHPGEYGRTGITWSGYTVGSVRISPNGQRSRTPDDFEALMKATIPPCSAWRCRTD